MKGIFFILMLGCSIFGETYRVDNYVFDFESGWNTTKGTDPNSILRIEKGSSYAEFIKLEDELSDFYLKSRLQQQLEQIESKALKASSIKSADIHSKSKAYYFTYSDKKESTIALFTYDGVTYSFISYGIDENIFKKMIFSFRKDGEIIEIPKPKPKPQKTVKKLHKPVEETNLNYIQVSENIVSSSNLSDLNQSVDASTSTISTQTINIEEIISTPQVSVSSLQIKQQIVRESFVDSFKKYIETNSTSNRMFIKRNPVPYQVSLAVFILYLGLCLFYRKRLAVYQNLKLKPYPKDMPPDFLFPFIITRLKTPSETIYQIITRTGQFLSASFKHEYMRYFPNAILWLLIFHFIWSITGIFDKKLVEKIFLSIPLGGYILSFIEIPFIAAYLFTYYHKRKEEKKLIIKDSQMNDIASVVYIRDGFVVKDSKGRDAVKVKKEGFWKRRFVFLDEDGEIFMEIKDNYPEIWKWIKILGNFFMKKRCYYSIFNEKGDMIGFLFLDPSNFNSYQVHFDFDFMRIINSVHLVSAILFIISSEKESSFLEI